MADVLVERDRATAAEIAKALRLEYGAVSQALYRDSRRARPRFIGTSDDDAPGRRLTYRLTRDGWNERFEVLEFELKPAPRGRARRLAPGEAQRAALAELPGTTSQVAARMGRSRGSAERALERLREAGTAMLLDGKAGTERVWVAVDRRVEG